MSFTLGYFQWYLTSLIGEHSSVSCKLTYDFLFQRIMTCTNAPNYVIVTPNKTGIKSKLSNCKLDGMQTHALEV